VNALFEAAFEVEQYCRAQNWRFCFIGGLAVQRWGEPRQTRDIDLTIFAGLGEERPVIEALLHQYSARLPDARQFALAHRVLLLQSASGVPVDVSLGALSFEARVIARAGGFPIDDHRQVTTCSAEDLVVLKAFADRPQDWIDVESIVVRQGPALDRRVIVAELSPLLELKEDTAPLRRLTTLFEKHRT
jgi:hypothetical protein